MKSDGIDVEQNPAGEIMSAKCSVCKRVEKALPHEKKASFTRSLMIAGWKMSRKIQWSCDRCNE